MTIKLYDGKKIEIPNHPTMMQLDMIVENIFSEKKYRDYYESFDYSKENAVGMMQFFDMLGWAYLTKSEHNIKPILARYKALKRKKKRTGEEELEYQALREQHVLYEDNEHLFFMNVVDECSCSTEKSEQIKEIKNKVAMYATKIRECQKNIKNFKSLMIECPIEQISEYYTMMKEQKSSISFFNRKIEDLISQYNELTGFSYAHVR